MAIFKNGSIYTQGNVIPLSASININTVVNQLMYLNGTDYIEIYAYQNSGSTLTIGSNGENQVFSGYLARTA